MTANLDQDLVPLVLERLREAAPALRHAASARRNPEEQADAEAFEGIAAALDSVQLFASTVSLAGAAPSALPAVTVAVTQVEYEADVSPSGAFQVSVGLLEVRHWVAVADLIADRADNHDAPLSDLVAATRAVLRGWAPAGERVRPDGRRVPSGRVDALELAQSRLVEAENAGGPAGVPRFSDGYRFQWVSSVDHAAERAVSGNG